MTATTAQGRRLPCDFANCTDTATVEIDAWGFCARHAADHRALDSSGELPPTRRAPLAAAPALPRPAAPSAPMVQVVGGGTIGLLLEQASGHSNARVRKAAERIEAQLEQLRELVASLAETEKAKQAEARAKQAARDEVARLEQQLAAAKAKLRGKPAAAPKQRSHGGSAGRSAHERHCQGAA